MSEIQIQSTITISQETINEIADRIFIRLKELADEYQKTESKESEKESFELNSENASLPKRTSRHRMRICIVNGISYHFKCAKEMFYRIGLKEYYGAFKSIGICHKDDVVQREADFLVKIINEKKDGLRLDSYTAHGFDGFPHTIMFEKEEEKANA